MSSNLICCGATAGFQRTVTVALDTAQYQLDMEYMQEHKSEDVYSTFNLLMRRKPKVGAGLQRLIHCLKGRRMLACPYWLLCLVAATSAMLATQAFFDMIFLQRFQSKGLMLADYGAGEQLQGCAGEHQRPDE